MGFWAGCIRRAWGTSVGARREVRGLEVLKPKGCSPPNPYIDLAFWGVLHREIVRRKTIASKKSRRLNFKQAPNPRVISGNCIDHNPYITPKLHPTPYIAHYVISMLFSLSL